MPTAAVGGLGGDATGDRTRRTDLQARRGAHPEAIVRSPTGAETADSAWLVESADVAAIPLFRAAMLLAILFDLVVMLPGISGNLTASVLWLRLSIVGSAIVGLLLSLTPLFRRNWRPLAFCICYWWAVACAIIAGIDHNLELLYGELMLLLSGTGMLLPWQMVWQGAYIAMSLAAYGMVVAASPTHEDHTGMRWVILFTAAGIAQFAAVLGDRHRRSIAHGVIRLEEEAAQRTTALAQLEYTNWRLALSETKLRKVFEASPDTICINSLVDGRYIDISKASLGGTERGYLREEALRSPAGSLRIWASEAQRENFMAQLRAGGGVVQNFEADFRLKDGSIRAFVISGSVVELDGEACLITVTGDISKLKQTQVELIAAREAALAARETALAGSRAKSEFLSNMSHELRTPMNAILGMADLLAETPLSAEQQRYVHTMTSNGAGLLDLINSILDLAKIESGRLRLEETEFDLQELVERLSESLGLRAHEQQVELAARILPDVPLRLIGDQLRLRQVLINLVGNAIKFTERGEVVLTIEHDEATAAAGMLRFSVRDTGIGIAREQLESVFDSFTQADSSSTRKYGGSGLGLAIAKRLVELQGGRIWVESEPGKGSTFYFTARFNVPDGAPREADDHSAGLKGLRVLVVDDNATNRLILRETLARRGAKITEADSGAAALEQWRRAQALHKPYKLILLDCRMPGMDGFETAERLKREAGDVRPVILMLTSDDLNARLARIQELGLSAYLVKPIRSSELLRTIAVAIGRAPAQLPKSPQTPRPEAAPARHLSILLAEDSPDNRILIQHYVRNLPYTLDQAENGELAVEKFVRGRYDVVLMDMRMPTMDGYTAVREIRTWEREQARAATPIVALTASALETDVRNCLDAGCTVHLSKPVKKADLLRVIHEITNALPSSAGADVSRSNLAADWLPARHS
jgi:two-component system, sensor histidine kinase and response regulator